MEFDELKQGFSELSEDELKSNFGELLKSNPAFASTIDARISKAIQTAIENHDKKRAAEEAGKKAADEAKAEMALKTTADLLDRRERALKLAVENNLDPATVYTLLGIDGGATDEDRIEALAGYGEDIEKKAISRILRENGRTIETVALRDPPRTFEEIAAMPDHMQRELDPAVMDAAIDEMKNRRRVSVRNQILGGR